MAVTLAFKFNFERLLKALKIKAYIPASFGALLFGTTIAKVLSLDVKSIGEIPRNIAKYTPPIFENLPSLIWPALMIALLAAIESLLSARVADSLAHLPKERRLEPDQELFGQGLATAMYNYANKLSSSDKSVTKPKHSAGRTSSGEAWAKSLGEQLPKRS